MAVRWHRHSFRLGAPTVDKITLTFADGQTIDAPAGASLQDVCNFAQYLTIGARVCEENVCKRTGEAPRDSMVTITQAGESCTVKNGAPVQ